MEIKTQDKSDSQKYVIHPDNSYKLVFDIMGLILIVYQTYTVPLTICFDFSITSLKFFDYFSDMIFILDVVLNFNTGFYSHGDLIMSRRVIAITYLKGWFCFDLLSSLPYAIIFDSLESSLRVSKELKQAPRLLKILRIVRFIKTIRLIKIVKFSSVFYKIEDFFSSDKFQGFYMYAKNMIGFFTCLHFLSCVFYVISQGEYEENYISMVSSDVFQTTSISELYLNTLYYLFTTFYTIGYGDLRPKSTNEMILAIFIMLFTYGLYCVMVSSLRNLVHKGILFEQDLKVKLKNTTLFFKEKNLPKELTTKVTKYLEFMFSEKLNRRIENADIYTLLNDKLGNELRIEINRKMLLNIEFLSNSKYDMLLNKFCNKVYEELISPNELIMEEGDMNSKRMYFIDKGNILLFNNATTIILKELGVSFIFKIFKF
jgi:hypothetical protein